MSAAGRLYESVYNTLCGKHPHQRPWHFQWLSARAIRNGTRDALAHLKPGSRILDAGCGTSPYRQYLPRGCQYTGLDLEGAEGAADIRVRPEEPWPLEANSFDSVLASQVLEHVSDPGFFLGEIRRALKPRGTLVLSVPFIYGEHGVPFDFRRFSVYGVEKLLAESYDLVEIRRLGKTGTVLATLFLNWADESLTRQRILRYMKPVLLPFWLAFCLLLNLCFLLLNSLDSTGACYQDTIVVAGKKEPDIMLETLAVEEGKG